MNNELLLHPGDITLIAHVYCGEQIIEEFVDGDPESVAFFLAKYPGVDRIIITDIFDRFVLSTFGYFVDQCPDKMYLSRLLEKLIPLQNGSFIERDSNEKELFKREGAYTS